jgi:hypothetical protein
MAGTADLDTDTPTDDELELPGPVTPGGGDSLLDGLIAQRSALEADREHEFELPNNGGVLWGTYRLLPWKQVKPVLAVFGPDGMQRHNGNASDVDLGARFLSDACVALWLRNPGARDPWPDRLGISDDVPMRYDQRLTDALRLPAPADGKGWTTTTIVQRALVRDVAMFEHVGQVVAWMRGAHQDVNDEFAGNS